MENQKENLTVVHSINKDFSQFIAKLREENLLSNLYTNKSKVADMRDSIVSNERVTSNSTNSSENTLGNYDHQSLEKIIGDHKLLYKLLYKELFKIARENGPKEADMFIRKLSQEKFSVNETVALKRYKGNKKKDVVSSSSSQPQEVAQTSFESIKQLASLLRSYEIGEVFKQVKDALSSLSFRSSPEISAEERMQQIQQKYRQGFSGWDQKVQSLCKEYSPILRQIKPNIAENQYNVIFGKIAKIQEYRDIVEQQIADMTENYYAIGEERVIENINNNMNQLLRSLEWLEYYKQGATTIIKDARDQQSEQLPHV